MAVLNVAFIGTAATAKSVAKLNDTRDIESYVHKHLEDGTIRVLSLLRPLRHPERLQPLLSVLNVARHAMVEIERIDAALGEVLVALGCSNIPDGDLIIAPAQGEWVDAEQVRMIQQQAGLAGWKLHTSPLDEHQIRERLFTVLENLESSDKEPLVIPVDQHFNVHGVGMVAIGYVQAGAVEKHQELLTVPTMDRCTVRSLQVMDDDVDRALSGDRVGVALRNLREGALSSGTLLVAANTDSESCDHIFFRHDSSEVTLKPAPFSDSSLKVGDVVHASCDLQFVVGRISSAQNNKLTIEWDQPLWLRKTGTPVLLLAQLDRAQRILGIAEQCVAVQ